MWHIKVMNLSSPPGPVAVVGASGYIGGRLVPALLSAGYRVRAISRSQDKLLGRPFSNHPGLETAQADALDQTSLEQALKGCSAVFDLVQPANDHRETELLIRSNLARACGRNRVSRTIELSWLVPGDRAMPGSSGMAAASGTTPPPAGDAVPVTRLRASMIIGSGSLAFETLRYLTQRLPIMLTPRWVSSHFQPIAVSDVLAYLLGCLENDQTAGLDLDIGGPDVVTFKDLIDLYAREDNLPPRLAIRVPMCLPRLSAYWINLVTPIPAPYARPLVESLARDNLLTDTRIQELMPMDLTPVSQAVSVAVEQTRSQNIATCWSDAGEIIPPEWLKTGDAEFAGGDIFECNYSILLGCPPEEIWPVISSVGGASGWFFSNILWRIRGIMDRLVGGFGLSRGRRQQSVIRMGDALDFWRVLKVEDNRELMLLAEMKVPGEAVLHFSLHPRSDGSTELMQIARFLPRGLFGLVYWYGLAPSHSFLFKGMLRRIARLAGCAVLKGPEKFEGGGAVCRLSDEEGAGS